MKKLFFLFTMLTAFALSSVAATWTVAGGSTDLFGTSWDPSNTDNDMTLVDGVYTWTKSGVALAQGSVEFKVCKDHGWGTAYPGSNYALSIPETASYDVTITFNESTTAVNATATKVGTAEITIDYYLVGETAGWSNNDDYKFAEDNGVYTLTTVFSGGFKIHTSTDSWYSNGQEITASNNTVTLNQNTDANMTIAAQTDPYTLTIEDGVLTITGFESTTPAEPYATIYIDMTSASGNLYAWDTSDYGGWPGVTISSLDTEEVDGTTYYVFNFTHSGASSPKVIFSDSNDQTEDISVADGDVLKYLGGSEYEKNAEEEQTLNYWLVGETAGWGESDDYKFAENDGVYTLTATFSGEFKIKDSEGHWYGDGETLTAENNTVTLGNEGDNMSIAAQDDPYTLTIENGVLTVTGFAEPDPVTVSSLALYGSSNDWAEPIATFTENEGFILEDQEVAAGDAFNIVVNYSDESQSWLSLYTEEGNFEVTENELGSGYNLVSADYKNFYFSKAGTFTFAVPDDLSTLTITGEFAEEPVIEPEFHLLGSFGEGDWEASVDNLMTQNGNVWTATVSAVSGDTFKFYDAANDAWYGGLTADETYGIHAGWCTNVPTATDGNANFALSMLEDAELTITLTQGEQGGYSFSVAGIPSLEDGYYLVGSFNEWKPVTGAVAFSEGVATAALEAAAQFKVLEAVDNELTWYGGDTEGNGDTYELKATWPSAPLTAGDAGSNFIINTAGEYTFTIEGSQLTVSGWDGCTLAEALAGNNAPISDELTVVRVKNGSAYVTDGNDNWLRVVAGNVSSLTPGCVINGYQLSGVITPAINPTVTFDGDLEFTDGENVPAIDEIDLQAGIDQMPKPAQVVKITGYYRLEGDEYVLSAYAGGKKGNTIAVVDANGSMTEGVQYTVEVAVILKEAWEAEGSTVTEIGGNGGIGFGGGGTVNPRAPRKIKASDENALSNVYVSVVGDPVATGVSDIAVDADVVSVKYVNVAGQVSAQPFDGINVVVTTYVDGTTKAVKVVK
ncbi:MAG: hypothetical protein IJU62_07540 [Muribaculaceae bacterium]|nr:hypothetical protein [Muribaculaceae bacterium]